MGLFIRNTEQESQLQSRITADLRTRSQKTLDIKAKETEPTILEDQHQTRIGGVIIIVLCLIVLVTLFWLLH